MKQAVQLMNTNFFVICFSLNKIPMVNIKNFVSNVLFVLDETDTCNVPSYAHTLVGVGGMVVTNDNRVLVVQERFRFSSHWKLPGGYVDPGEDIDKAAVREVFEETGIQTKFR